MTARERSRGPSVGVGVSGEGSMVLVGWPDGDRRAVTASDARQLAAALRAAAAVIDECQGKTPEAAMERLTAWTGENCDCPPEDA